MKTLAALLVALAIEPSAPAATAYVTDELVLGVYASQTTLGPRLATLHSGATVDTLAENGDATQVRLPDGMTGWVKSAYLTTSQPATVRLKALQEEMDQARATAPGLAEAAERSEVARLTALLEQRERSGGAVPGNSHIPTGGPSLRAALWVTAALVLASTGGFWLGYAMLARRLRYKFGGIKVY